MNEPLPRCVIRPLAPDEGTGYLIEFPEYPGCIADGPTPEAALREGYDALRSYCLTLEALGHPLPGGPASFARLQPHAAGSARP